jgi:hypothetical protein
MWRPEVVTNSRSVYTWWLSQPSPEDCDGGAEAVIEVEACATLRALGLRPSPKRTPGLEANGELLARTAAEPTDPTGEKACEGATNSNDAKVMASPAWA